MPAVVTATSMVTCAHEGKVAVTGVPKLTVGGSPVVVAAGVVGQPIAGCSIVPPPATNAPCTLVLGPLINPPSLATKLFVSGNPVVLATLQGTTNGELAGVTPQPGLSAIVTQTLLTAI